MEARGGRPSGRSAALRDLTWILLAVLAFVVLGSLTHLFDLDAPVARMGGPDVPAMGFASSLEHAFMPNADTVAERMLELARF